MHTKGPWSVDTSAENPEERMVFSDGDRDAFVAVVVTNEVTSREVEANAALISAAPDLLEAIQHIGDWLREDDIQVPADLLELCNDAVTKALGR